MDCKPLTIRSKPNKYNFWMELSQGLEGVVEIDFRLTDIIKFGGNITCVVFLFIVLICKD